MRFSGDTYRPELDGPRLESQLEKVRELMGDGSWRTLQEIQKAVGGSEAGISARLRDLRKERFGSYVVNRRRLGDPSLGLFQYQLLNPKPNFRYEENGQAIFI